MRIHAFVFALAGLLVVGCGDDNDDDLNVNGVWRGTAPWTCIHVVPNRSLAFDGVEYVLLSSCQTDGRVMTIRLDCNAQNLAARFSRTAAKPSANSLLL